jgi:carboxylesterase
LINLRRKGKMAALIIPTAEPFFFPGNRTACLLVHGFTGTPKEMRWLGEYLAGEGYTVLGVRLAGHATQPRDMTRTRWKDWVACVEDGWHQLQGNADRIFVMGLSMGGVLSLYHASQFPVAGVVAMSTPYDMPVSKLQRFIKPYARALASVMPFMSKGPDVWFNPEAEAEHVCYPRDPVRAGLELDLLLGAMRDSLSQVSAPTLLMHSRDDPAVLPEHMPKIYDALGSEDKEMVWVEKSGHVITRDGDRERVFRTAAEFVRRVSRVG